MSRIDDLIAEKCTDGVEFKLLQEVCRIRNGKDYKGFAVGSVPVFGTGGIMTYIDTSVYDKPSVLIPRKGSLSSLYFVDHPFWTVDTIFYTEIFEDLVAPEFLYFFLATQHLEELNQAGGVPSLTQAVLNKLRIPVPHLDIQHEIVSVLDTFTQLEAELEAELEARRVQYEYYRDSLLTFTKPTTWSTLGDICINVTSGGTPSTSRSDFYGGSIPWLRTQEVDYNRILSTGVTITESGLQNSSAKWIPANCVIVAMYGATAAKAAINAIPLTTNQACCNLEVDSEKAHYRFVYYWMCREYKRLRALGEGSQSNLNAKKIKDYPVPLPPLQEQERIVLILDKFDTLVNDLSIGLPAELNARRQQYEHYRDRMLTFDEVTI
jgi:type I restriction enzyme S subunit